MFTKRQPAKQNKRSFDDYNQRDQNVVHNRHYTKKRRFNQDSRNYKKEDYSSISQRKFESITNKDFKPLIDLICEKKEYTKALYALEGFIKKFKSRCNDKSDPFRDDVLRLAGELFFLGRTEYSMPQYKKLKLVYESLDEFLDVVKYNILIDVSMKRKDVEYAMGLFQEMVKEAGFTPSEVTYNAIITGCSRNKILQEALPLFEAPNKPTKKNFDLYIYEAMRQGLLVETMTVLSTMQENGFKPDTRTVNNLLKGFVAMKKLKEAEDYFMNAVDKFGANSIDDESYRILISGFSKEGMFDKALDVLEKVKEVSKRKHFIIDARFYNIIISQYVRSEKLDEANKLFTKMVEEENIKPSVFSYKPFFVYLCKADSEGDIYELLVDMKKHRVQCDEWIYGYLIGFFKKIDKPTYASNIVRRMKKINLELPKNYKSFKDMDLDESIKDEEYTTDLDVITYILKKENIQINTKQTDTDKNETSEVQEEIKEEENGKDKEQVPEPQSAKEEQDHDDNMGIKGDFTENEKSIVRKINNHLRHLDPYNAILEIKNLTKMRNWTLPFATYMKLCSQLTNMEDLETLKNLIEFMRESSIPVMEEHYQKILECLLRNGNTKQIDSIFAEMTSNNIEPSTETFNTVIRGYKHQIDINENTDIKRRHDEEKVAKLVATQVLRIYKRMKEIDAKPNAETFCLVFEVLGIAKRPKRLLKTYKELKEECSYILLSVDLYNSLLTGLYKSGKSKEAQKIFEEAKSKDILTETSSNTLKALTDSIDEKKHKKEELIKKNDRWLKRMEMSEKIVKISKEKFKKLAKEGKIDPKQMKERKEKRKFNPKEKK